MVADATTTVITCDILSHVRVYSPILHNLLQPSLGQKVSGLLRNLLLEMLPIAKAPFHTEHSDDASITDANVFPSDVAHSCHDDANSRDDDDGDSDDEVWRHFERGG